MRTPRLLFVTAILLCSTFVYADGLVNFKGWDATPQAYFMTKAERQEWSTIQNDDAAHKFVESYLARRGPGFPAMLEVRVAAADKHLTVGKLPGSQTLRGKLVILLGPPSSFEAHDVADYSPIHRDNGVMAGALTGGTANAGGVDEQSEGARSMGSATVSRLFHFTYAATPAGPLDVNIMADANNGKDHPRGRDDEKRLDAAFEAAAQASIKTK
ncbi:MAG TPA: GWxTD domain-containing protein [Thermoanaerobaculia bacterium]|nr:GWxTD domain-containing protein [Thermoanaerobaculia bacterium]